MATLAIPARTSAKFIEAELPSHHGRRFWPRFCDNRAAVVGLVLLATVVLLSVLGPLLYTASPQATNLDDPLAAPSLLHPLGTDHLGRDILARLLNGGRTSLGIAVASVALALVVSIPLGTVSGYYLGWVDLVIQRLVEILLSFPGFLLALSLAAVLGVGLNNVILSAGLGAVPGFVRLIRAMGITARYSGYVDVARGLGASDSLIIWRHILPNALPPLIVQATIGLGGTMLTAAGLGFLGLGVQQTVPEWGAMLGEGRQFIFNSPNLATFPGLAIFVAVLSINLVGDGLRDALDPLLYHR